jgi:ABC-type phosphate/phosphonate transport system substrate-binding protein
MLWVLRRKVHAGAMDNQTYLKEARDNLSSLKILHKTFSIPRQVVSHRGDLPSGLVAKIKDILVTMQQSEEGKKTLANFENTTQFDDLPEPSIGPLLKLQGFIDAEVGRK